jgi:hypothetical protein
VNYTAVLHAVATVVIAAGFVFLSGDTQLAVFGRLDIGDAEAG